MAVTKNMYMEKTTLRHTSTGSVGSAHRTALKNWFFGSLATLAVTAHSGYAQSTIPQRDLWVIGNNVVPFNGATGALGVPYALPTNATTIYNGLTPDSSKIYITTTYHDENGNLLFYISDGKVYDWEARFIGDLFYEPSSGSTVKIIGFKDIAIMPDKCNPRVFYIIATNGTKGHAANDFLNSMSYFTKLEIGADIGGIADPLADGFLGFPNIPVTTFPTPPSGFAGISMLNLFPTGNTSANNTGNSFAVSKIQADGERLLFVSSQGQTAVFKQSDIVAAGYASTHPIPIYTNLANQSLISICETELFQQTPSVIRLANIVGLVGLPHVGSHTIGCFYQDFTYSAGTIAIGPIVVLESLTPAPNTETYFGLEFSQNGSYLYFTNNDIQLGYFDLTQTAPTAQLINPSQLNNTGGIGSFVQSQIELGKDGAMYFSNGNQLARLANTNNPLFINPTDFTIINLPVPNQNSIAPELAFPLNDQVDGEVPYPTATGVGNTLAEVKCCMEHRVYTVDSYTVNGANSQTWTNGSNPFNNTTGIVSIKNRLIIPAGYSVTINNMVFEYKPFMGDPVLNSPSFVDGAKCILERSLINGINGGQLTLNNTDFRGSNTCYYGMWDGVEVQGDPNAPQQVIGGSPLIVRHQARLLVYNNSIIQDAYYGATNYEFDLTNGSSTGFFSFTSAMKNGGIIVANNATFKNNYIGVAFAPYSVANVLSNFTKSNFLVTAALKNPLITPLAMVLVFQNKIMNFKTCNFKNQVPGNYPIIPVSGTLGLHGILAFDASLNVFGSSTLNNPAPYSTGCVFENLAYGIRAFNFNISTNTILLQSSIFTNNWRGSYFGSYSGASVTKTQRNKYYVNETAPLAALDAAYGHYLDYCNNFIVQENRFYYNSFVEVLGTPVPVAGQYNAYGCIVNEENPKQICEVAGYKGDVVYKNLFQEINIGAQAQGFNSEEPNNLTLVTSPCHNGNAWLEHNQGLKYVCNTFAGTDANDITVMTDGATANAGRIAYQQGSVGQTAGNVFSHVATPFNCAAGVNVANERELYIDQTGIKDANPNYLNYTSNNGVPQTLYCFSPLAIANPGIGSTVINTGVLSSTINASGNLCPTKIIGIIRYPAYILLHKKLAKEIIKLQQPLIDGNSAVLYTTIANGTANQINTALNTKSPYLSDGVLIAAIRKGLPSHTIRHILVSNSPLTAVVKLKADSLPLDANTKQQITNAQTGISPRRMLEGQISDLKDEQHGYEIEALYGMQADTLNVTADSLVAFITYLGGHDGSIKRLKVYIAYRDTLMAKAEMMAINVAIGGSPLAAYLSKLTDIYIKYTYGAIAITKDPATMVVVEATRAETTAYESKSAEGIHESKTKNPYREWIQGKTNTSAQRVGRTDDEITNEKVLENSNFKLYPNPSSGVFYYHVLSDELQDATIEVYDITGKRIVSGTLSNSNTNGMIDLSSVANGMYFVKVANAQKILFNTKINVVK